MISKDMTNFDNLLSRLDLSLIVGRKGFEDPEKDIQLPPNFVEDMNKTYNVDGKQISPLQYCIQENRYQILFAQILKVQKDFSGALQWALKAGNTAIFQKVLKAMQDQAQADHPSFEVPVQSEASEDEDKGEMKNEEPEVVVNNRLLPIPAQIDTRDESSYRAVDLAIELGATDALRKLMDARANLNLPTNDWLPIQRAILLEPKNVAKERINILSMLLEETSGVKLDVTFGETHATLLILATSRFQTFYLRTLLSNKFIKDTINETDALGNTALHYQCKHMKDSKVPMAVLGAILLLNAGATIDDNSFKILVENRDNIIKGLDRLITDGKYEDAAAFIRVIKTNNELNNVIFHNKLDKEDTLEQFVIRINNKSEDIIKPEEIAFAEAVNLHRDLSIKGRVSRLFFSSTKKDLRTGDMNNLEKMIKMATEHPESRVAKTLNEMKKNAEHRSKIAIALQNYNPTKKPSNPVDMSDENDFGDVFDESDYNPNY